MRNSFVFALSSIAFGCTAAPEGRVVDALARDSFVVQEKCLPGTFQGCCSYRGGIADLRTGICRNGSPSPTCTDALRFDARGYCRGYKKLLSIEPDGTVVCARPKPEPTIIPRCK